MALSQVVIFDTDGATQLGTARPFPVAEGLTTSVLGNGTSASVTSSSSTAALAPANTGRKLLILQNTGSGNVRIGPSTVTSATGVQLVAGGTIIFQPPFIPSNAFFAILEGATTSSVLWAEAT